MEPASDIENMNLSSHMNSLSVAEDGISKVSTKIEGNTQATSKSNNQEEQKVSGEEDIKKFPPSKLYKLISDTHNWEMVSQALKPLSEAQLTLKEITQAIEKFIKQFEPNKKANIKLLEEFLGSLNTSEKSELEKHIFPGIATLILKTPSIFPEGIQISSQSHFHTIKITKEQCACLLAHMIMCTTIDQHNDNLPKIFNFSEIFTGGPHKKHIKIEKLKCMFHYLKRILKEIGTTPIIFERLVLQDDIHGMCDLEAWKTCKNAMQNIVIKSTGTIEDAENALEIDFANKLLGGATLKTAAAQEQIMFFTSPELIVGMLLFEGMMDNEAILLRGTEVYCTSKGYRDSFKFGSDFIDKRDLDSDGVMDREIVAIDALDFRQKQAPSEFSNESVLREINKAYVGFYGRMIHHIKENDNKSVRKRVSTGKWGCGVFLGNPQLKLLVQWIAASRAKRELYFYTFGNEKDLKGMEELIGYYKTKEIGKLVQDMLSCCEELERLPNKNNELFELLIKTILKNQAF